MRRKTGGGDDSTAKIIGGAIGVVIGCILLYVFFTYGLAALLGAP